MPLRRSNDDRRADLFGERSQRRGYYAEPAATRAGDDERYRPRRWERSFGWARRRDVDDSFNQQAAPPGRGRYDRSGEERYARGLEQFDAEHEHSAPGYDQVPSWGLGYGGMQASYPMGSRDEGPYRGRGPRGYQRADDRIREDVCENLTEAGDVDASEIEVGVTSGAVTLSGTVSNRYEKRRAEDLAESVSGVKDVQNHLRLQPDGESGPGRSDR